jgi:hypothetical protein
LPSPGNGARFFATLVSSKNTTCSLTLNLDYPSLM